MGGGMVSSTGTVTLNTANRVVWGEGNASEDIMDWSPTELQTFVKWFIEVNYPEAVKQYQAIRAIERKADENAKLEAEVAQLEMMRQYWANQARGAQNAYQYPTTAVQFPYTTMATQQQSPKKQGLWSLFKDMVQK